MAGIWQAKNANIAKICHLAAILAASGARTT